jgi:hypothetical protein
MWRNGYCNACATYFSRYKVHKNVEKIYAKVLMDIKKGKIRKIIINKRKNNSK